MSAARPTTAICLVACVCAVTTSTRTAWCGGALVELSVRRGEGAEDCPDESALRARVEKLAGRSLSAQAGPEGTLFVDVEFARDDNRYRAVLRTAGARQGERSIDDRATNCDALSEALGVTIALLLDRPSRESSYTPLPRTTVHEGLSESRAPTRAWTAGVGAGPTWGLTQGSALGVHASVMLELSQGSVALEGVRVLARSIPYASGRVRVGLTSAQVELCRVLAATDTLRLSVCGEFAAGRLEGEGVSFPSSSSAALPWFAAGFGARLGGPFFGGPVGWGLRAQALFPLREQTFSVQNAGVAYESSSVTGWVSAELRLRIW